MLEKSQPDYLALQLRELPAFRALIRGIECRLFSDLGQLEEPVLDVGCGDGHFAALAYSRRPALGIDIDPAKIREAYNRGSHDHLALAAAHDLPLPDACMASVTANCVMEHIPLLDQALGEIFRVLQPGGQFIFGVPSQYFGEMLFGTHVLQRLGLRSLGRAYGDWFNRHSKHYHTDSPQHWLERLQNHGFRVEQWQYYMSAAGLRAFDLAHYLSIPRLLSYKLTGQWVTFQIPAVNRFFEKWLHPHYASPAPERGAYIFFQTRRPPDETAPGPG